MDSVAVEEQERERQRQVVEKFQKAPFEEIAAHCGARVSDTPHGAFLTNQKTDLGCGQDRVQTLALCTAEIGGLVLACTRLLFTSVPSSTLLLLSPLTKHLALSVLDL